MTDLARVVIGVRRRMALVAIAERLAIGAAGASGLLLFLHPGAPLVVAFLSAGALIGAATAVVFRPSLLAAALKADRQIQSGELLSTAWLVSHVARPSAVDLEQTVIAMAQARCRAIAAADIRVARLSSRHWGALALLILLSITVNLLTQVGGAAGQAAPSLLARINEISPGQTALAATARNRPAGDSPTDVNRPFGEAPSPASAVAGTSSAASRNQPAAIGAAGDFGTSTVRIAPTPLISSASSQSRAGGLPIGGSGQAGVKTAAGKSAAFLGDASPASHHAAPWQSAGFPSAVGGTAPAQQPPNIDPRYQDLIRDYFTPAQGH